MRNVGKIGYTAKSGYFGSKGVWTIDAEPHIALRLKRIFPRVQSNRKGTILVADTPEIARDLSWVLERWPMELTDTAAPRLEQRTAEFTRIEEQMERIMQGGRWTVDGMRQPVLEPRDYQLQAADAALTTGRLLLGDDLGLGKSLAALLMLRAPDSLPALIVVPTHLPKQWLEELAKFFPMLHGHIIKKTKVYDPATQRDMHGQQPDVLIINYAKLYGWADHLAGVVRTVIFDEMQDLRLEGSQKAEAAGRIADQATYRMGMTATPVYNYGGEIFSLINTLEEGVLGTRTEFIREWCKMERQHVVVNDPKALGAYLREQGLFMRRTRADVKRELPAVQRIAHSVDVDEDVFEKLSKEAVDLAAVILNSKTDPKVAFKARGVFDWKLRQATGISKAPYVAEFIKLLLASEEKVVLWGWHRAVYDIWMERLEGFNPVLYTGSESPAAKGRSFQEFVSGESRLFIMSLRSGAGINGLQEISSIGVFGELDWSPGMHDQCIGRLNRDGQDDPVSAYFLVSDYGTDPMMAQVLNVKRQQAEPIRDPTQTLFEPTAVTDHDRIRRMAEQVYSKRGEPQALEIPTIEVIEGRPEVFSLEDIPDSSTVAAI